MEIKVKITRSKQIVIKVIKRGADAILYFFSMVISSFCEHLFSSSTIPEHPFAVKRNINVCSFYFYALQQSKFAVKMPPYCSEMEKRFYEEIKTDKTSSS